ncbi:prolyl oligopeptidase family serine peptidase [Amycolatopsis sp. NPDC004625]|uniref:prolyl oligopeptidase family serine peptidase n=1 Tax=Amycolatopsis sp. NPDC004625 TaxID=3154670 RepID=UPI0033B81662
MSTTGSGTPPRTPPAAPVQPTERTLHGETVVDAFGWMRDHADPRLRAYLEAEREYFDSYAAGLDPLVGDLVAEAGQRTAAGRSFSWRIGDHEYTTRPPDEGGRYTRYLRRDVRGTGEPEVVLDLGDLARGHDFTRIGVFEPSPDGRLLAYSVDHVGYESYELRFRDLTTGADLPRTRPETYYTGVWDAASAKFCYVVHDAAMRPYRVLAHDVTADPGAPDAVLWDERDEHFTTTVRATRTRDWLVVTNQSRTTTEELLLPTGDLTAAPRPVMPRRHGQVYFADHQRTAGQDRLVALVAEGREERRLVALPLAGLDSQRWQEILPRQPDTAWQRLDVFAAGLLLSGYRRGTTVFTLLGPDGGTLDVTPDSPGGCLLFEGRRDALRVQMDQRTAYDADEIELAEHTLSAPPRHRRLSLRTGAHELLPPVAVPGLDPARFRTTKVFAGASGGAVVPVTLAHRADVRPDGANPAVVSCYGAYERPWEPSFSQDVLSLLDRGFVYAIAHVRGGGELGRCGWFDGSMAATPASFHDLVAVRDHLVATGWAHPAGVVASGSCAGGVAVGQAYTDEPGRWAGIIAEAPAVDLLNAMLDEKLPLTINEWEEWGDPRDPAIHRSMREYVAYENVSDRPRPPLLVTAYANDPRVLVHEPARWTAALRQADTHGNVILLRTELGDGGHHGPSGAAHVARAAAQLTAFAIDAATRSIQAAEGVRGTPA